MKSRNAGRWALAAAGLVAGGASTGAVGSVPEEWMKTLEWRSIGPATMGGRITALAVYEADPCIWWAATASGGLLKTTNNGVTFEHQFDHEATASIGDVAVAQSDPAIVWVGTGESNPRNSVSWGNGVYKSTDGGATWTHQGLDGSFQIGRIAIHPDDPDVVYVGVLGRLWGPNEERGLFRTTDGGATWEKVLYVDEHTGVIDVGMSPSDPDTLLVATWERERDGFDTNDPAKKWGPGSGLYRTTDAGATFEKVTEGLPAGNLGRIGLDWYRAEPNTVYAIIESERIGKQPENAAFVGLRGEDAEVGARLTAVTEDGPAAEAGLEVGDIVVRVGDVIVHSYADLLRQVRRHLAGETVELELSRDRKSVVVQVTFGEFPEPDEDVEDEDERSRRRRRQQSRSPFSSSLGGQRENMQDQQGPDGHEYGGVYRSTDGGVSWERVNTVNPRPMYFSQIRVDPSDDDHMYVLGISLHRSKDGGETFTGDGGRGVHPDHHAMWIDPNDGRHIILGNDGGLYVTYDRMERWDHLNHVAIGQFYHVTVGPRPSYRIYGGLQDNGSWGGPVRSRHGAGTINEDWFRIGGGDGFVCRVDAEDPDQVYFESQNGGMGRTNLRTGERGAARPRGQRGTRYRFNWKTPFVLSNHNSRIHYAAGNHVFRSLNRGTNHKLISPEITRTDRGSATALAESPLDPDVLYVGTDDGALWMTPDGGKEWIDLFAPAGEETPEPEAREAEGAPGAGGPRSGRGGRMRAMLERADADGDGRITRDEAPDRMQRLFERFDANDDGVLDKEEIAAAMAARRGGEPPAEPPAAEKGSAEPPATDESTGDARKGALSLDFLGAPRSSGYGRRVQGTDQVTYQSRQGRTVRTNVRTGKSSFVRRGRAFRSLDGGTSRAGIPPAPTSTDRLSLPVPTASPLDADVQHVGERWMTLDGGRTWMDLDEIAVMWKPEREAGAGTPAPDDEGGSTKEGEPKKEADSAKETDSEEEGEPTKEADSAKEGEPAKQEASDESAPTPEAETPAAKDDPVSGTWTGQARNENMPPDRGRFTLELRLTPEGKVIGRLRSDMNDGAIDPGTYDAEKGRIAFDFHGERRSLAYRGRISGDRMTGTVEVGDFWSMEFEATRTSAEPPADLAEDQADVDDGYDWKPISALVPEPRWVSSIEASRAEPGRVYVTFDGHRSDDDRPHLLVSENQGRTWRSIRGDLPDAAGSARVVREDVTNPDLLYLGCEFSAWVSLDRGTTWISLNTNLPTVAVHELAQHPACGDLVAGTHGRSLWVLDVTPLRRLAALELGDGPHLLEPNEARYWRSLPSRGGSSRRFVGANPPGGAHVFYCLPGDASTVSLRITDLRGKTVRALTAPTGKGMHRVDWDLRREPPPRAQRGRRSRGGPRVEPGTYLVALDVDGTELQQPLVVKGDPEYPDAVLWGDVYDEMLEFDEAADEEGDRR